MPTLPNDDELISSGVTEGQFKAKLSQMLGFMRDLLGTTGLAGDARVALGLGGAAINYVQRGAWSTGKGYAVNDLVTNSEVTYVCQISHTSGIFSVDQSAGKWAVYQGATKAELAATSGSDLVGHLGNGAVPQSLFEAVANTQHIRQTDISPILTYDSSIVITGDSLSFNAYDFPPQSLSPGGYASDNVPGLMSWAHMLRDVCYASDPFFMPADRLTISGNKSASMNGAAAYTLPFNNRYQQISGAYSDVVTLVMRSRVPDMIFGNINVILAKNPNADRAGTVDLYVDNSFCHTINVNGSGAPFGGFELVMRTVPSGTISFRNFKNPDGTNAATPVGFFILGVSHHSPTVNLTGHGGWKASQVLSDFNGRIGQYAPDILFMIIGANDIHTDQTPDMFYNNLVSIVTQTRALKPNCQIILISSPPCSTNGAETKTAVIPWANQPVYAWLKKMEKVARDYKCFYLDLYQVFENVPTAIWRVDNIHFKRVGNNIVYRALKDLVFPSMPEPRDVVIDSLFQANGTGKPYAVSDYEMVLITHNGNTWGVLSDPGGVVSRVYQPGGNAYELAIEYSKNFVPISFDHFGASVHTFLLRPYNTVYPDTNAGLEMFYVVNLQAQPPHIATAAELNGAQFCIRFMSRYK